MSIFHGFDWLHSHSGIGFQLWPFQRKMDKTMDRGWIPFQPYDQIPKLFARRVRVVSASHGTSPRHRHRVTRFDRISAAALVARPGPGNEPRHQRFPNSPKDKKGNVDIDLKRTHYKEYIILKYAIIYTS